MTVQPNLKTYKKRLDQLVWETGLAPTKSKAQALILAGEIQVAGKVVSKAGQLVPENTDISLTHHGPAYVSRGGIKLASALDDFDLDPTGWVCLDVGASTGGFSDCLLQHGAKHVFTLDVGKGQLDQKLREDSRVTWKESFHVKKLTPKTLPQLVDLAVVDVSFISLQKVLWFVLPCVKNQGWILALIKPQFEASPKDVSKGGVLRDESKRQEIIETLRIFAVQELGLKNIRLIDAKIKGPKGNQETFLLGGVA